MSLEELFRKHFCNLIFRHDLGNTRTKLYNKLLQIRQILCPSELFNNFSNSEFEKMGRLNFQKHFIFSICPENFVTKIDGYITEKLYMACISVTIPIYNKILDDNDVQIFNVKRIISYDPTSDESI